MHTAQVDPKAIRDGHNLRPIQNVATGAEALAHLLQAYGLTTCFAYPGTSELHLCDSLVRQGLRVINSRGDREAVFMAAGANRAGSMTSLAVLHGARGLTNALGAVADARRSEARVLCLVGMAATASSSFLPPHAEPNLLEEAGAFAVEARTLGVSHVENPVTFLELLRRAIKRLDEDPGGPVLLGLPQDLVTTLSIPRDLLADVETAPEDESPVPDLGEAIERLATARRPVILLDDYALAGTDDVERDLGRIAARLGAPVLQVRYRRGPMLFQAVDPTAVPTSFGFYRPDDPEHRRLIGSSDLLITVEDRNMYPRVVGDLSDGRKLVLTSNASMTLKNGYVDPSDLVIEGKLRHLLADLKDAVQRLPARARTWCPRPGLVPQDRQASASRCRPAESARELVRVIGQGLRKHAVRLVIDDSQMFGGLVSRHRDLLPPARILGSHGGFVGSGLPTAVGAAVALGDPTACLLGDQGLINAVQALTVASQEGPALLFVVCNNGSSVSLRTQAKADGDRALDLLLANPPLLSYSAVARGFGLTARKVAWPGDDNPGHLDVAKAAVLNAMDECFDAALPLLLEIVTPDDSSFWEDVWSVHGLEATDITAAQPFTTPIWS